VGALMSAVDATTADTRDDRAVNPVVAFIGGVVGATSDSIGSFMSLLVLGGAGVDRCG